MRSFPEAVPGADAFPGAFPEALAGALPEAFPEAVPDTFSHLDTAGREHSG